MRIVIDRHKCIGGGNCVLAAPSVFTQDEQDGLVVVLDPRPPLEKHTDVEVAVEMCPAKAIYVEP